MSHTGVDVIDFILLAIWPVIALFVIEILYRIIHFANWIKLGTQATILVGFAISYIVLLPTPHIFTALVLIALAVALVYQARKSALDPKSVRY